MHVVVPPLIGKKKVVAAKGGAAQLFLQRNSSYGLSTTRQFWKIIVDVGIPDVILFP